MSKLLINIRNKDEIEYYEKIGITNFLFAVENLSIGYDCFSIKDIPDNSYLFINRVLDNEAVDYLKSIKDELLRFKGIIYEDIAVYKIFKDTNIELIWFQNHFTTNYLSINFWLNKGASSAVISNEITEDEIKDILAHASKPLVLNVLGKNQIMYSRRSLLSNFNNYNNLDNYNDMSIKIKNRCDFLVKETNYGTVIFNNEYFNYTKFINSEFDSNIKFYLILNLDLDKTKIKDILDGGNFGNDGFLNKKTVYRMSEYDDRK